MSNRSLRIYFGPEQEQAVADYISAKTKAERDRIYSSSIHQPFCALTEGVLTHYSNLRHSLREDIRADLPSKLWLALDGFDSKKGLAFNYFTMIIFNHIKSAVSTKSKPKSRTKRKSKALVMCVDEYNDQLHSVPDDFEDTFSEKTAYEEALITIENVAKALDDHEQIVFRMYFTDNRTMRQIADHVGISIRGVHMVVKTIRKKLRAEFGLDGQLPKLSYKKQKPS